MSSSQISRPIPNYLKPCAFEVYTPSHQGIAPLKYQVKLWITEAVRAPMSKTVRAAKLNVSPIEPLLAFSRPQHGVKPSLVSSCTARIAESQIR